MLNTSFDEIYETLSRMFPNARCELDYRNLYELMLSVAFSAQTTDKSVNKVTPALFRDYPTIESMSKANPDVIESYIKAIGLSRNKAQNAVKCCQMLMNEYNGVIPNNLEDLKRLPGIGQKTANVILSEGFKIPRIAVDTHVERVSKRLGIVSSEATPLEVENTLMSLMPEEFYHKAHHLLLFFGRYHCFSRNPQCDTCPFEHLCTYKNDKNPL